MIRRLLALAGVLLAEPDRPAPPSPRRLEPADPTAAELAAVQASAPAWLVMWCRWRRQYAAFARFGPATIIYEADPAQLLRRCRTAEYAAVAAGQATVA